MKFELNGEFIRLGDLLKAAGFTGTGGEAKQAVQDGLVLSLTPKSLGP